MLVPVEWSVGPATGPLPPATRWNVAHEHDHPSDHAGTAHNLPQFVLLAAVNTLADGTIGQKHTLLPRADQVFTVAAFTTSLAFIVTFGNPLGHLTPGRIGRIVVPGHTRRSAAFG